MSDMSDFDGYADFDRDPTASIAAEFGRLAIQNDWKKGSKKYKNQRADLITYEFGVHFGSNLSTLEHWQALCKAVGITNIPSSNTQCKKVGQQSLPVNRIPTQTDFILASQRQACQHLRSDRRCSFRYSRSNIPYQPGTCGLHREKWQDLPEEGGQIEQALEIHVETPLLIDGRLCAGGLVGFRGRRSVQSVGSLLHEQAVA
jgi:hypothetical protein